MASFFAPKSASSPRLPAATSADSSRRPKPANAHLPAFRRPSLSSTMPSNAIRSSASPQIAYPSPSSQIEPYPGPLSCSPTPHPQVTVSPVRTAHIPSLMRTTSLLLPVRYSNAFYSATITDPVVASVSRVALYHDPQLADTPLSSTRSGGTTSVTSTDKVIGGIRCRLEPFSPTDAAANNLYIQTLHLLSAYRGHGIATSLLESLIYAPSLSPPSSKQSTPRRPSDIVQHYNIRTVTAHVHEANDEALNWYRSRGFSIQDGVVEGYYRRLKPSGAKIVKLDIARDEEQTPHNTVAADQEDEDWEKVEAEDCCPTAEEADAERIRKKVKSR